MSADNKPAIGRPKKGNERRISVQVYMPATLIETIDGYVMSRQSAGERSYSRSEFINEAINKHMQDVGLTKCDENEK